MTINNQRKEKEKEVQIPNGLTPIRGKLCYPWSVTEPGTPCVNDGSSIVRMHALLNEFFH